MSPEVRGTLSRRCGTWTQVGLCPKPLLLNTTVLGSVHAFARGPQLPNPSEGCPCSVGSPRILSDERQNSKKATPGGNLGLCSEIWPLLPGSHGHAVPGHWHSFWYPEAFGTQTSVTPGPVADPMESDSPLCLPCQPGQRPPPHADPEPGEGGSQPFHDSPSFPVTHSCPATVSILTHSRCSHGCRWNFRQLV